MAARSPLPPPLPFPIQSCGDFSRLAFSLSPLGTRLPLSQNHWSTCTSVSITTELERHGTTRNPAHCPTTPHICPALPRRHWPPLPILPEPLDQQHVNHVPLSPPSASRSLHYTLTNEELGTAGCLHTPPSSNGPELDGGGPRAEVTRLGPGGLNPLVSCGGLLPQRSHRARVGPLELRSRKPPSRAGGVAWAGKSVQSALGTLERWDFRCQSGWARGGGGGRAREVGAALPSGF